MSERSNAKARDSQDAAPDVSTLQKRGRRRLVGAIALVLLAVIVLPMVFDPEPKPRSGAPLVNIRIPSEEGGVFTPKALPKPLGAEAPAAPAQSPATPTAVAAAAPVAAAPTPAEAPKADEKPAEAKTEKKAVTKAEQPPAQAEPAKPAASHAAAPSPQKAAEKPAPTGAEQWLYQVGAFASAEKVKEISDQLKAAKLPHYTESVATAKGKVTRVRLGPFTSRQAAEHALERAKALGLNPVNVAPK